MIKVKTTNKIGLVNNKYNAGFAVCISKYAVKGNATIAILALINSGPGPLIFKASKEMRH